MDDARALAGRLGDAMIAHVKQVLRDYDIPDDTIANDPEIASTTREVVTSAIDRLAAPEGVGLTRYELVHRPTCTTMEQSERGDYVRHQDATRTIAERDRRIAVAVDALEIIAGRRRCLDNLLGNRDVALQALTLLSGQQDTGGIG
jgi:hypothetical protein